MISHHYPSLSIDSALRFPILDPGSESSDPGSESWDPGSESWDPGSESWDPGASPGIQDRKSQRRINGQ